MKKRLIALAVSLVINLGRTAVDVLTDKKR